MDIWFAVIFTIKDTGNGSMLCVREDFYVSYQETLSWEKEKKKNCQITQ